MTIDICVQVNQRDLTLHNGKGPAPDMGHDENGLLMMESTGSGTITAEYAYMNGQPLAKIENSNVYYYHNDHLGTPMMMTDASGTVVWSADYKPFGETTVTVSTITNNIRFPGQYYDSETGLHQNWHRDYKAEMGRYVESDPIGIEGGKNHLYVYVGNNTVNWIDPRGWDRYTICEGEGCVKKWLCKKAVNKSCGSSQQSEAYCCDVDKNSCLAKIDANDPQLDKKIKKRFEDYSKCMRGIK